jgi:O-antigen/teichoic acid export membrane protein
LTSGLVASALAARLLGPEGYGVLALLLSVVQLFYAVGVQWSMAPLVRFGREALIKEGRAGAAFWTWVPLAAGSLAVAAAVAAAAWPFAAAYAGVSARTSLLVMVVVLLAVTAVSGAVDQLLQMSGKMAGYALGQPLARLFLAGALAAVAVAGGRVTAGVIAGMMAAGLALQVAVRLPLLEGRFFRPASADISLASRMASYAAPLVLGYTAAYVSNWVDVVFLRAFRPIAEVGVYQVAYQGFLAALVPLSAMSALALPVLLGWRAAGDADGTWWFLERLLPRVAILWSAATLAAGLAGRLIVPALFGAAYEQASRYLAVLLIGAAFQLVSYGYSPVYAAHDALGRATAVQLVTAVVNVAGDALLVPRAGAMGAAAATAFSYAAGAALSWVLIRRRLPVRSTRPLLAPCVVAVPLAALAATSFDRPALISLAVLVIAVIVAWQARAFTASDRSRLASIALAPARDPK